MKSGAVNVRRLALSFIVLFSQFQFIEPSQAAGFTLTISSSGSSPENTNWTYSAGAINLSAAVTISPTDIESKLAIAPLIINAGRILINSNISSSTANDLTFKSEESILVAASTSITTQGGDVILWSDTDSTSGGQIRLGWSTDTSDGSISTNGGDIVLGGGSNPRNEFAIATSVTADWPSGLSAAGVALYGYRLSAAGGNISIRGKSALGSGTSQRPVFLNVNNSLNTAPNSNGASITTSGTGSISIIGDGSENQNNTAWSTQVNNATIQTASGSVLISGISRIGGTNPRGVNFANTTIVESTNGGNITIRDLSDGNAGVYNGLYNGGTTTLKTSGTVLVQADEIQNDGSWILETSSATFKSYTNTSFTASTIFGTITATNCNELNLGQVGNTAALTLSAITVAGPLNIYGAAMTLGGALTATNSTVSISASGAVTQSGAITATNLALNGSGTFTLQNASNNVSTVTAGLTGSKVGQLKYTDSTGGLTVGTVNGNSGIYSTSLVEIATTSGDLNVSTPIVSDLSTGDAVLLYANKSASIEVAGDGDVKISGTGAVTISGGARALLYSGTNTTSTGLTALVGGNINTRSPYTATTAGSSLSPSVASSGLYAIYRTSPTTPIYDFQATNYDATTGVWTDTGYVPRSVTVTAKSAGLPLKNSTPYSVEFNGSTNGHQFINGVRETNAIAQAFTISTWFKTTTASRKIVGFEGDNGAEQNAGYDKNLFIDADGKLVFATQNGRRITSTDPVTNNQWQHAVATYTGTTSAGATNNQIKLYLNGSQIGLALDLAPAVQATGYWRIGGWMMSGWLSSFGYYSGSIGQVSIYNRAISQTDAQAIYANTRSTYEGLTPSFGTATPTSNGFTVQISNYDADYTWAGTATASGSVSISGTGLVTVTGVAPLTSSTATITSTRTGYSNGTATVSETSTTGGALTPTFGSPTSTADGFTASITNYDAAFTWATPTVSAGSVAITSTTGATRVLTVTGLSLGATATITQTTSRTGYSNGTATVSGTAAVAAQTSAADNSVAQAEAARKAKEQQDLINILALIPKIGGLTLSLGETTRSLYSTRCVKGKTTKFVKKGSKCPKGFVRKR